MITSILSSKLTEDDRRRAWRCIRKQEVRGWLLLSSIEADRDLITSSTNSLLIANVGKDLVDESKVNGFDPKIDRLLVLGEIGLLLLLQLVELQQDDAEDASSSSVLVVVAMSSSVFVASFCLRSRKEAIGLWGFTGDSPVFSQ